MPVLDGGVNGMINVDGMLVEKDVYEIASRIKEYDENLEIMCLDPSRSSISEAPYVVVERGRDGVYYKVLECWALDASIIDRIAIADTNRHDVLDLADEMAATADAMRVRRYEDRRARNRDLFESFARNKKSKFTYKDELTGDLITIKDNNPNPEHH